MTDLFFDAAVLLTTWTDEEFLRRKCRHIEKNLNLPEGFVQVHHNEFDKKNSKRGCFNAHYGVYNWIVENNYKRTLIFEDDVHFMRKVRRSEYQRTLRGLDWEVFYFGHKPDFRQDTFAWSTSQSHVIKVRTNDRHAYAMTLNFAKRMAKMPWTGKFGDRLLRESTNKAYAHYPMAAIQSGPIWSASFRNGITEKFSEYLSLINQRPIRFRRTLKYILRFLYIMPYSAVLSVILAFTVNRYYPKK